MENGGGNSSLARPGASRKRCRSTISSVLGKTGRRISQLERPFPQLRMVSHDQEGTGKAPDKNEPRSISMVAPGGLRFSSQDLTNGSLDDELPRATLESEITTIQTVAKPGGLRFGSESNEASMPVTTFQDRNSSLSSDALDDSPPKTSSCNRPQVRTQGRNTMGIGSYMKSVANCADDVECTDECGYGTGCQPKCREVHGFAPDSLTSSITMPSFNLTGTGGPGVYAGVPTGPGGYTMQAGYPDPTGGLYKPVMECEDTCPGPTDNTSQLNFYIMLLLEVFGVLIFFAICTITFWITLAYHFIKLLLELKNADRNTQVAVAIVFGLLFLAFAICHLTSGCSTCGRHSEKSQRNNWRKGGKCGHLKDTAEPKTSSTVKVLSQIKRLLSIGCGKCHKSKGKSTPCSGVKASPASGGKNTSGSGGKSTPCSAGKGKLSPCRRKTRYTDCEGRAIFINSRRYAIPTEMKQPPTILVWLLDVVGRYM